MMHRWHRERSWPPEFYPVTADDGLPGNRRWMRQEVPSRETRGDQGEEVHWHPPGQKNITPPGPEVNPKDNPEKIRRLGDFNYRNAQRVIIRTLER
nr:unnamed protein product [Callosobruchus chinensis]